MSSSKQQTDSSQTSTTNPSSLQLPYLTQAFQGAQNALGTAQQAQAPTNFTAQFTPDQLNAFSQMLGYGTNNGAIPASSSAAGANVSAAGANGVDNALSSLSTYAPQGGVGADVAGGNQFVNGMNIPALVKAQMLPAEQEASEQVLPQIARAA